jgi:hypothetical protein
MKNVVEPISRATIPSGNDGTEAMNVSVVVPVTERPAPLAELYAEYAAPLRAAGYSAEFIFVAAPWSRPRREPLLQLARQGEPVRVLEIAESSGEASLVRTGAEQARGPIVITLPAYYRVEAAALPELVRRVEHGAELVVARRWPRRDSWINQAQNRALHTLVGRLARGQVHDVACGVRAMRRDFIRSFPLYGDSFRFLPLLALRDGYRTEEVDSPQHPKDVSPRLYSPGIYLRRLLDILGLFFLIRFREKPLRFFGLVGSVVFLVGATLLGIGVVERITGEEGLANRPILLFGVLLIVLGVQAIALGLIGEIIVHLQARRIDIYRTRELSDRRS